MITTEFSFRLRPSKNGGVGVFATHDIAKNTRLDLFIGGKPRYISQAQAAKQGPEIVEHFYKWFCVEGDNGYYCAQDFRQMEIGWYLNHSKTPNIYHKNYTYYALVDIKKGEELVVDYATLDSEPQALVNF